MVLKVLQIRFCALLVSFVGLFLQDVTVRSLTHAQHTCSGYDEQWEPSSV